MFTDMDMSTLQQQIAEAAPNERVLYCMELARRFREGIGVEPDEEEAQFWENYCRTEDSQTPKPEITLDSSAVEICEHPERLSGAAAYRAYCTGDPGGMYSYAVYLDQRGEKRQAAEIYEELISKLEQGMGVDYAYQSSRNLLIKAKYTLGQVYAADQTMPDALKKAISYTEEAVLELHYYQGLRQLIDLYRKDGLTKHEQKLLPMLEKMEDGSTEQRVAALDSYCNLERWGLASAVAIGLLTEETNPRIWAYAAGFFDKAISRYPHLDQNPCSWAGSDLGRLIQEQELVIDPEVYSSLPHCGDGLDFTVAENCERVSNYTLRRLVKADNLYAVQAFSQRIWQMGDYKSVYDMLNRACAIIEAEANVVGIGDSDCAGVIYWLYGGLYELGWGCEADPKKAFDAMRLAAVKYGNQNARFRLFAFYRDGFGTAKNLDEATRILTKYAEAGSVKEKAESAVCFAQIGKSANAEVWGQIVLQDGSDPKVKAKVLYVLQKTNSEDYQGKPVTAEYIAELAEKGDSGAILAQLYADVDACKDYLTDRTDLKIQQGCLCPGIVVSIDSKRNITVDLHGMGMGVLPEKKAVDMEFLNSREGCVLYNDLSRPIHEAYNKLTVGDRVLIRLTRYNTETGKWNLSFCKKQGTYDYAAFLPAGQAVLQKYNRLVQEDERLSDPSICKAVEKQVEKCSAMAAAAKHYSALADAKHKLDYLKTIDAIEDGTLCGRPVDPEVMVREVHLDSSDPWARAVAMYTMLFRQQPDAQGRIVTENQLHAWATAGDPAAILARIEQLKMAERKIIPFFFENQQLKKQARINGIVVSIGEKDITFRVGLGVLVKNLYGEDRYSSALRKLSVGDFAELVVQNENLQNQPIKVSFLRKTDQLDIPKATHISRQLMHFYGKLCEINPQLAENCQMDNHIKWHERLQLLPQKKAAGDAMHEKWDAQKKKKFWQWGNVTAWLIFIEVLSIKHCQENGFAAWLMLLVPVALICSIEMMQEYSKNGNKHYKQPDGNMVSEDGY